MKKYDDSYRLEGKIVKRKAVTVRDFRQDGGLCTPAKPACCFEWSKQRAGNNADFAAIAKK